MMHPKINLARVMAKLDTLAFARASMLVKIKALELIKICYILQGFE
jgi:hypothetical protein